MVSRKQIGKLCAKVVSLTGRRTGRPAFDRIITAWVAAGMLIAVTAATGKTAELNTAKSQTVIRLISSGSTAFDPDAAAAAKAAAGQAARDDSANDTPDFRADDASDAPGTFVTFDVPGAVNGTYPFSMNPEGTVTGYYVDASSQAHGFLRSRFGTFTTFDVPGDVPYGTLPTSINPEGAITGVYYDTSFVPHSFLRDRYGALTTFEEVAGRIWTAG